MAITNVATCSGLVAPAIGAIADGFAISYSSVVHYLKTVKELDVARAKDSGREVIEMMKRMRTEDD